MVGLYKPLGSWQLESTGPGLQFDPATLLYLSRAVSQNTGRNIISLQQAAARDEDRASRPVRGQKKL
jgi:hypothetical protein